MLLLATFAAAHPMMASDLKRAWTTPQGAAAPWVLWHWVNAAVSSEGITADIQAMRDAGLGGAYLMTIKGPLDPPLYSPAAVQLTPQWWKLVRHAAAEADRSGLQLAAHVGDGFAVAGGPWITPELSMQQVVWSRLQVDSTHGEQHVLPQPRTVEDFYRDIAVLAFPAVVGSSVSSSTAAVEVRCSTGDPVQQLAAAGNETRFRSAEPCTITYRFEEPFCCRSLLIRPDGNNLQCHRLQVEASDDGSAFRNVAQLSPPRHGWQDGDRPVTHAIPPTTARVFRFVFDPAGTEPGSEDLDHAKWSPVLKIKEIRLSSEPRIHQFRGKNGSAWRVSPRTTDSQVPASDCIALDSIRDVTGHLGRDGILRWKPPAGTWTILRIGHTSTGAMNTTAGGGKGLECDKLNAEAIRLQFDRWFAEIRRRVGAELASRVVRRLFIDSWECGSQNWTAAFGEEFRQRRGYDLKRYLPAVAGYPIESAEVSERFLYDMRQTIAELLDERFFATLSQLAAGAECTIAAECVAPTMLADGMQHFKHVDMPMGEFWLHSPTHDKPNDIRDAVSAGHVYGKQVIAAEAFTQLRTAWDEHPAMLKPLADRHFALGINQLVYHVFVQNPWLDRAPGATLGDIGLYFQRDQIWWPACRAWVEYCHRVQALLQQGSPVVDIAVFTGEEFPRRSVLPERLVECLPGLVGEAAAARERERLANRGVPLREQPPGVKHAANMTRPSDWDNSLGGYKYDSINRDALLHRATVRDGKIVLPGGASYALLVVPGNRPMNPNAERMTPEVLAKLSELAEAGANILLVQPPTKSPGLKGYPGGDDEVREHAKALCDHPTVRTGPWRQESLAALGFRPDFEARTPSGGKAEDVDWAHRQTDFADVYFVANQQAASRKLRLVLRSKHAAAELWDPTTGETRHVASQPAELGGRTVEVEFAAHQSLFLVLDDAADAREPENLERQMLTTPLPARWSVDFQAAIGPSPATLELDALVDLSESPDAALRYFAGRATYTNTFTWHKTSGSTWLDLGDVAHVALVHLNDQPCGTAWTAPWRVDVTDAIASGENHLSVTVFGTWRNRLLRDRQLPGTERRTWTTATTPSGDASPAPFGLLGPVTLVQEPLPAPADRP